MGEESTLDIYRNCGYELPLLIQDEFGFPENLAGYGFALLIAPTQPNRSFGTPVITNTTPVVSSGVGQLTFVLSPTADTPLMTIGTAYEYRAMMTAPGGSPMVLQSGRIRLRDAPVFP